MKTFGEALKELRTSAKLTQEQLAQKCGMTKQSISRYEKSDREPNIRTAKTIADALNVPLSSLVPSKSTVDASGYDLLQFFAADPEKSERDELLTLFDQLPAESRKFVIGQLRGAVQALKAQDDQ